MKKLAGLCIIILCLGFKNQHLNKDVSFAHFKNRFILAYWKQNPMIATSAGFHNYDSLLPAYSENFRKQYRIFCHTYLDSLHKFDSEKLDASDQLDKTIMYNALTSQLFYQDTFKAWQWDPSVYNIGSALAEILQAHNLKPTEKHTCLMKRIWLIREYYEQAMDNIVNPTLEHIKIAIEQNEGTIAYLKGDFYSEMSRLEQVSYTAGFDLNLYIEVNAVEAIQNYILFLKDVQSKQKNKGKNFRIGKALYDRKFELDIQSNESAKEIYLKALKRKDEMHTKMTAITTQLWPKYFKEAQPKDSLKAIRQLIQKISLKHVSRDLFLQRITAQISQLSNFVKEKNLIYLDPDKPLMVRKTPAYMDGVAGASISAPGPYDKEAETFYNVSTLEKMSSGEAESYLREYNFYALQILNIHEAIPGHYVQLIYANQSPSLIKTLFSNGAMVEGWAVYSERMMLENGYGNNEPEMQLMYCKWHLRSVCNTILDYSVHVLNWDQEKANLLLTKEAFQQQTEANGKWRRVSLTQVQLCSYFSGYTEIYELRERLKQKGDFDQKAFHEKFLSFGSAPVKEIAKIME
ncbi:MAG: DUF885 domain-containing protein [Bacteroidia bacterium]|nr:DUF885 domain-containing protein [Bacteroidia bacterium]